MMQVIVIMESVNVDTAIKDNIVKNKYVLMIVMDMEIVLIGNVHVTKDLTELIVVNNNANMNV
jgi:hypothetical protein